MSRQQDDPGVSSNQPDDEPLSEDALSWAGDDAYVPSHSAGPAASQPPDALTEENLLEPTITDEVDEALDQVQTSPPAEAEGSSQLPSSVLIFLGIIGGWFMLYTIGWFIVARANWAVEMDTFILLMHQAQLIFVVASPALWFLTVWSVTRKKPFRHTVIWLLIGALMLLPWPYFLVSTGGGLL